MIDLHMHSTFSDGSLTPAELAAEAKKAGLTAISLTDHDSTSGVAQLLTAGKEQGIRGIPGVEISCDVNRGTMHILGYFMDPANSELQSALEQIRDGRESRNLKIIKKLNSLGINVTWEQVKSYAGEDVVGRPHFSQALVAGGHVDSNEAAFERYLAKGRPAYVERFRMTPADGIRAINGAGGVPVLAHPFTLELGHEELKSCVRELTEKAGLKGIEVFYPEHSRDMESEYAGLAKQFNLVATGGSDFHGAMNPAIRMGRGFGSLSVPDNVVEKLLACAGR